MTSVYCTTDKIVFSTPAGVDSEENKPECIRGKSCSAMITTYCKMTLLIEHLAIVAC
jgi:hypothetical protein